MFEVLKEVWYRDRKRKSEDMRNEDERRMKEVEYNVGLLKNDVSVIFLMCLCSIRLLLKGKQIMNMWRSLKSLYRRSLL